MKPRTLEAGDVVQLNPEIVGNKAFTACFMIVTDPKSFGAQGYIQGVGETREAGGGQYYYRAKWAEMEYVGRAEWIAQVDLSTVLD